MKTKYIQILFITFSLAIIISCEKTLEFEGKQTEPKLILNGFLNPDSFVKIHLSESKFFLDNNTNFHIIENANVRIFKNDIEIEQMQYVGEGYYLASFKPVIGDKIMIKASYNNLDEVSCHTDIIEVVPMQSAEIVNYKFEKSSGNQSYTVHIPPYSEEEYSYAYREYFDINIKINDPHAKENYYRLVLNLKHYYEEGSLVSSHNGMFYILPYILKDDINRIDNFHNNIYTYSSYNEFSDEAFNGKEYLLKVPVHHYYNGTIGTGNIIGRELHVNLQSIAKPYYLYLQSRTAAESSGVEFFSSIFSEPVQVYSNIEGGIGFFGSYANSSFVLDLGVPDFE